MGMFQIVCHRHFAVIYKKNHLCINNSKTNNNSPNAIYCYAIQKNDKL